MVEMRRAKATHNAGGRGFNRKSNEFALRKPNDFPSRNGGRKTASGTRLNQVNTHRQSRRFGLRVPNYSRFRNGRSEKAPASDPTRMTPDQYKDSKCLESFKLSNGKKPVIPPQQRPTAKNNRFDHQEKTNLESATHHKFQRNQNSNLGWELSFYNHLKLKHDQNSKDPTIKTMQNHEGGPKI